MTVDRLMPDPCFLGNTKAMTMGEIIHSEDHNKDILQHDTIKDRRRVLGYCLPSWQRELVWSEEQCIRFIESAYDGLHLGTYVLNEYKWSSGSDVVHPLSNMLIDGQQRIHAISEYLKDKFKVYGYYYSETTKIDKRLFDGIGFARASIRIYDEEKLKSLYNKLNFGGTAHKEYERA